MAGYVYDKSAINRIENLIQQQEQVFTEVDKEDNNRTAVRYAIIVGGSVLVLVLLKILIDYKKR
jgi:hypothetical protein